MGALTLAEAGVTSDTAKKSTYNMYDKARPKNGENLMKFGRGARPKFTFSETFFFKLSKGGPKTPV